MNIEKLKKLLTISLMAIAGSSMAIYAEESKGEATAAVGEAAKADEGMKKEEGEAKKCQECGRCDTDKCGPQCCSHGKKKCCKKECKGKKHRKECEEKCKEEDKK